MTTKSKRAKHARLIQFLLRHDPGLASIVPDEFGYMEIAELCASQPVMNLSIMENDIQEMADADPRKRIQIVGTRVRARYGHSFNITRTEDEYAKPPDILYHGSCDRYVESIYKEGSITSRNRQSVHMHVYFDAAYGVGQRHKHGGPKVLMIDTASMYNDGHRFVDTLSGTWLTEVVPVKYCRVVADQTRS